MEPALLASLFIFLMSVSSYFEPTDEELMLRYADGHAAAFETLLNRYEKRIFWFILRYLNDEAAAADLLQETFMSVIKSAGTYRPTAKFSTWVLRIARNKCIDYTRKKRADAPNRKSAQSDRDDFISSIPSPDTTAEDKVFAQEINTAVNKALDRLPDNQREVFILRQVLELSFREISETIMVSENTVKSRLRYALQSLRYELERLNLSRIQGRTTHG